MVGNPETIQKRAEYLIGLAHKEKISLLQAALRLRATKRAEDFRRWCWDLTKSIEDGRAGIEHQQALLKELNEFTKAWGKDINERVEYRTRALNFEKFPHGVGSLLKAASMHKLKVHDPLLTRNDSCLMFLNDLLRPPRMSSSYS
jgi:hypothetical protein